MPLSQGDIILCQAATMAVDFTTANIGGARGPTIVDNTANTAFFPMNANPVGGSTLTQHTNLKYHNNNWTGNSLQASPGIFVANGLDANTGSGNFVVQSDNAADNGSYFVHGIGLDVSGLPIDQNVTMNGTTPASSTIVLGAGGAMAFELRAASGGALTNANGNISITVGGQLLGYIPAGRNTAIACLDIGIDASLNTPGPIANAATAPGGITFSRPRTTGFNFNVPVCRS